MSEKQWLWMMKWCRDRSIPPGDETNWGNARSAYVESVELNHCINQTADRPFILENDNA